MLELQKILLLVRFFNQISCNNGLKAKISCLCFFCFTSLRLECFRSRKTALFLMSHWLKKYKNLHPQSFTNGAKTWYKVKIANFWRKIASYLSEMKTISMFCNLSLFQHFWQLVSTIFLFWRYLISNMTRFLSDILLPCSNSNDLNSRERRVKQKFTIQKKNSPFKSQVISFLDLKHTIESAGV